MTTTIEYLDALKIKLGAISDYDLSKKLGVTRGGISSYRVGRTFFDDDMCLKVASILDLPPIEVILNVHAERSQNPIIKASFSDVLRRIGQTAAMLLFATGLYSLQPAPVLASDQISNIHYAKLRRRKGNLPKTVKIDLSFLVKNMIKSS